uniref:RRM domain-containing protein n=1 Tax=Oryza meridionalis TaxID=40149 RepID=A0A0E0FDL6_9ORYZ
MDRAKAASREDKAAAGKETAVSRPVAEDDTALLLAAVGSFRKEGSDASRMLDQEMSTRLLHLACKHDAVQCARLLLEGGHGITASPVDARDQLTRTPLQVAAEAHSARAQVKWSLDNSIEDLLSSLQEKDLNVVRLLAEKTREVGEVAYRYAMEGRVTVLAMLLLVAEEKISAPVSVVIEGVRTKKSIYYSIVDEALSIGDAPARDSNERRKALLSEIQLLNQFGAALWRDRNIDKRSLPPLLKAAKVGDVNVTKMLLMGDVDVNEADPEGNTALHWCLSGSSSTQEPRIVWLLLKNGARVFQGNKLGLTPVHSAAAKGNYKALQSLLLHAQDCVDTPSKTKETPLFLAVKNGSLDCVKLLLRSGASTKVQNLRKQRPIDVATSQDMHFILTSANVVPWNRSSHPKKIVTNKESCKEFLDDNFVDYDSDDLNESFTGLKTSASHRDFRSSNGSAQGGKSKNHCAPKQGSKFVPRPNHWLKHDYTRKIFVGGLPLSVGAEYLTEFFTAEFGPVEEAVVIGIRMGDRVQSRGFGFVKFKREEDVISAKETHHVYMLGKRVMKSRKLLHSGTTARRFQRKWLPGFLADATERLGDRYPLSSLKGDFRAICRMELDHGTFGYPKLSDFMRSLPGICRMCVVPVGSGPATHMVLLPPVSRPKYVPLLEPFSFDHDELPESVSDHQSPRSPLTTNITEDSLRNTDSQKGDTCSESNVQSHQGDECCGSNTESQQYSASTDNGSLPSEVAFGTTDLVELVQTREHDLIAPASTRRFDFLEPVSTREPNVIETVSLNQKIVSEPLTDLLQSGHTRRVGLIDSRSTCLGDFLVERVAEIPTRHINEDSNAQIFVVGCHGQLTLQVDLKKKTSSMIQAYEEKTGINHEYQYFIYERKVIDPDDTLSCYGIEKGSTIHACSRLRGGASMTLGQYLNRYKDDLLEDVILLDGRAYPVMKPEPSGVLRSWLKCFTTAFSKGYCWGENFLLSNFKVVNGKVEVIKEAKHQIRTDFLQAHLRKIDETIRWYFCRDGERFPPYLDELCDFLKLRRGLVLSEDAKEFIDDHVCFMNSYERGMLGIKLYKKLNSLSPGQKLKLLRALEKIDWDLSLMDDVDKLPLLCDIIVQAKAEGKPFPRTILGGFRLLRDYFAHIPEHQYDKATKPWKRKFRIYIGIELMIPVHLKKLLPRIIKCFLDAKIDIKRELLSSHTMRCSICYSGTSSKAVGSSTTPQTGHATKGTIGTSNELGTSSKAVGSSTTPQTGQDTKRTTRSSNELVETSSTAQRNTWSTGQAARILFAHSSGAPSAVQQQSQDDWETVQKRKGKKRISK